MISVFSPRLSFTEKIAVFKSVFKNDISGTSPVVRKFEEEIAKQFDRKYAIAVSNGSVALDVALNTLDLKDEQFFRNYFAFLSLSNLSIA